MKHPSLARNNDLLEVFLDQIKPNKSSGFTQLFREKLWLASDKRCAYCGCELECFTKVRVDHFEPKSKVNNEHINNYICSCHQCNSMKCNSDIEELRFRLAVYNSPLRGVVLPSQAKQLLDIGVELPICIGEFYFERCLVEEIA